MKLLNDIKNGTSHSVDFLLSKEVEETLSKKGIKIRKVFSPLIQLVFKTQTKYKLVIEGRNELESKTGNIFVVNHRQADDIVLAANVIKENGYFVFGNKYLALDLTNGLGLWANGVILLERDKKESRKATLEKIKYVLQNGGNIIIYPEGYWNLDDNGLADSKHASDDHNSDSWLMQDLNIGVFRIAKELGSNIVPVVLHYDDYKNICYGYRGKSFKFKETDNEFELKDQVKEYMQTIMYTMMEKYSSYKRESLKTIKEDWIKLKEELVKACDIKSIDYHLDLSDEKLIGKAKVVKDITTNEEAFNHLDNLDYNKNNAFLLNKNLGGRRK